MSIFTEDGNNIPNSNIFKTENVEKNDERKYTTAPAKYIVKNSNNNFLKGVGLCTLVFVGGIVGGGACNYLFNKVDEKPSDSTFVPNQSTNVTYTYQTVENPVVAIAESNAMSVVGINVTYTSTIQSIFGAYESEAKSSGTGIIYTTDGYVITNCHVIESAVSAKNAKIYVTLSDDTEYEAKIVGYDALTDIAVLKVEATNLKAAKFGDSDSIKVGEMVVAIGNPLGQEFAGTVTVGYISGVNRTVTIDTTAYNLIQTDAAINSGNSGGPLVNISGEVIGVNTAKIASTGVEGLGFSIPINDVLPIVEELIQHKTIARPYIGIGGIDLSESVAARNNLVVGIYIQEVEKDSPAYLAGLKQGDVIVAADGIEVATIEELNEIKNEKKVGDSINIKVYRNKQYKEIKVTLGSSADFN
jgi:serine protease Do